jgi:anti-sigma factor RsiW
MTEKHPNQLELLAYVEHELDPGPHRELAEHLAVCPSCAEQVGRLEAGREALRAAPLLDLSEDRKQTIMWSLPDRPDRWAFFRPVKRALVVAAPVAGAAALIGVFVLAGTQLGGGGDDDAGGEAAQVGADEGAAETTEQEGPPQTEGAPLRDIPAGATFVRTAQGPAAAIVRALKREGITAEVDAEGRVIAEARAGEVRAALAGRPPGDVPVYVR